MQLYKLADNYMTLMQMLEDNATDAIVDTLESIEGELSDKAENIAKISNMASYEVSSIEQEIKRLQDKKRVIENGQDRLRQYLKSQMERISKDKIKTDLYTISIRKNPPRLILDDETKIPAEFLTLIPERYEVQKDKVKECLKSGEFVPGAHLESGSSLQIK